MLRAAVVSILVAGCAAAPTGGPVTAYEGARIITGDGRVIQNGTVLVASS